MAPANEAMNFLKAAMNNPTVRRLFKDNIQKHLNKLKKNSAAGAGANAAANTSTNQQQQDQWKAYEQYQQQHGGSSSSSSSQQSTSNKSGGWFDFKNYDWKRLQEQALQFVLVNFMGVMFVFQIFNGIWQSYQKEKKIRERRREQEERAHEQRGLVVEQMAQRQKLSQQLMQSKSEGGKEGAKNGGKMSDYNAAKLKAQQDELNEKIHEASVQAIYQPISGVGVAEVSGFDNSSEYTADIPVQVWIHGNSANENGQKAGGEKSIVPFDPLSRWNEKFERRDRSYDPLTGLAGNEMLKIY